jgi:hypothetical protein
VGGTSAEKVANEWWVTFTVNGADIYGLGHQKLATYNTAANNNEIWIDDYENTWQYKVKALVDYSNLTFKATQADDEYHGVKVNITNGKFLLGAGRSKTGNVADSIYFQAEFSDDPGTINTIAGHSRTRFSEDDYH